ncbi:transposase [Cellulosilyticum sp. ST5]
MAHIQEKGWFFLIRVKDGINGIKNGLDLPKTDCFDIDISLKLTRKKTNAVKELFKDKNHYRSVSSAQPFDYLPLKNKKSEPAKFYELHFRIVRFPISETSYETIVTNLNSEKYPPDEVKKLYASRWGIETSFRDLKYTIGMLDFHSKKVMCIQQEIYAHMIMYNFAEMITSHVVIEKKQRKHTYKANFSVAVHMCRLFYHGKATSPDVEAIIAKNLIPIRPDRHRERNLIVKIFHGFLYRVA